MPQPKVQALKVDPEKYPGLAKNPALERALRIQQALDAGKPREEAVTMAEHAMGKRAPTMSHARPPPARQSAGATRGRKASSSAKAYAAAKSVGKRHR